MARFAFTCLLFVCVLASPAFSQRARLQSIEQLARTQSQDCQGPEAIEDQILEPFTERQKLRAVEELPAEKSAVEELESPLHDTKQTPTKEQDAISDFVNEVFDDEQLEEQGPGSTGGESAVRQSDGTSIRDMNWSAVFEPTPRESSVAPVPYEATSRDPVLGVAQQTTYPWAPRILAHRTLYFEDMPLERYGQTSGPILQPIKSGVRFFADALTVPLQLMHEKPCDLHYVLPLDRPGNCSRKVKQRVVPYVP